MPSLKSCIGIHAAPPQLAKEILRIKNEYQKQGYLPQRAIEKAILDVQGSMRTELDAIHAQILAANPAQVAAAQNAQLTRDQQQIADLKAAGLEVATFSDVVMNDSATVQRIYDKLGGLLTTEEIAQIIGTVESRYKFLHTRLKSDVLDIRREFDALNIDQFVRGNAADFLAMTPQERSDALLKAELMKALETKKEDIRRKRLSEQRDTSIKQALDTIQAADPNRSRITALTDYLVGNIRGKGVTENLQAKIKGETNLLAMPLQQPIKPFWSALRGVTMSKENYTDLVREFIEPNSTGNSDVAKLAQAISGINDTIRTRLNKAGADMGYVKGYIPQAWHRRKIMFAGLSMKEIGTLALSNKRAEHIALNDKARTAWTEDMMTKVDRQHPAYIDATTGEYFTDTQMRDFLRNAFDTLTTDGATKGESGGGNGSIAGRLSSERSLFFKDADAFLDANNKYGQADVLSAMISHIQGRARDLTLLENMDAQNFETALAEAKKLDGKSSGGMFKGLGSAEAIWMELSGMRASHGTGMFSDAMRAARNWQVFTKLGSALLSQPSDMPTFALMAVKDGLGFAPAVREMMSALNPLNKGDKAIAEDLGLAIESVYNDAGNRFMDATNDKGLTAKLAQFTIKAGGMKYWTDSMKRGFHILMARGMARESGKSFTALDAGFKQMLTRNGIDAAAWDVIRSTAPADLNGRDVIVPSQIADAKIRAKMFAMFADEADYGVMEPGARERAAVMGTMESGTWQGEFMKSFALFKMFSISMMTKTMPRLFTNLEGKGFGLHMAAYALAMIGTGAFSTQLKELAKGRNPRDMHDPKFWIAAAGQSGGLGIFSDFVFGDVNRMGQSFTQTMAGPLFGAAQDLGKLTIGNAQELAQGKPTKAAAETLQFVKNNTIPNLWYTKQAIDALLFNRAIEAVNPGYLRRMQGRVERENNTTFWWKPGETLPGSAPDFSTVTGR